MCVFIDFSGNKNLDINYDEPTAAATTKNTFSNLNGRLQKEEHFIYFIILNCKLRVFNILMVS